MQDRALAPVPAPRPVVGTRPQVAAVPARRPVAGTRPKVAAVAPAQASRVAVAPAPAPETSAAIARALSAPVAPRAFVAPPTGADFDGAFDTALFQDLAAFEAVTAHDAPLAIPSLADARGYDAAMLYGLSEIAHHYLTSGGVRLALVIFEGLTAIAPQDAYFRLGLGFALDRAGRTEDAMRAYEHAIALDPADARAELNLAELHLERGERASAKQRLANAQRKAVKAGERALADKAAAISARV